MPEQPSLVLPDRVKVGMRRIKVTWRPQSVPIKRFLKGSETVGQTPVLGFQPHAGGSQVIALCFQSLVASTQVIALGFQA